MQDESHEDAQELHWQEHRADIFLARVVLDLLCARDGNRLRPRDFYDNDLLVWDDPGELLAIAPLPMDDICNFFRSRYEDDKDRWKSTVIPKMLKSELVELCDMADIQPPTPHRALSESSLTEDDDDNEECDKEKATMPITSLATPTLGKKREPPLDNERRPGKRARTHKP